MTDTRQCQICSKGNYENGLGQLLWFNPTDGTTAKIWRHERCHNQYIMTLT